MTLERRLTEKGKDELNKIKEIEKMIEKENLVYGTMNIHIVL